MQKISGLLTKPVPKSKDHRSERGDLITFFANKVNAGRDGKRYRKLPVSAIAVKLSHLSVQDLYYLKSTAEDAERRGGSFSKTFWWSLRPQEINS